MASQAYPPFICPNGRDHRPHTSGRRSHINNWMHRSHGIVKDAKSNTQGYTAEDFARYAGHGDVLEILASLQG